MIQPSLRSTGRSSSLTDTVERAFARGVESLERRQEPDGHWAGDYGGPNFLLPGLVITFHITGRWPSEQRRANMVRYLRSIQRPDGGFGLHIEDDSTVLGTALNYTALRLLGVEADDPDAARARARLHALGGAEGIPTWGKWWLAVLAVYRWEGVPPLLPELYLLPEAFPAHPSRLWCHTRQVFLPMSYGYGRRLTAPLDDAIEALREELFVTDWKSIRWTALRYRVASADLHTPHTPWLTLANRVQSWVDGSVPQGLRERACAKVREHMRHQDETTHYLTIGPVSKAMHTLIAWFDGDAEAFDAHIERVEDYLWDAPEGTKMQGYNGSQLWDCAFAVLAVLEGEGDAPSATSKRVLSRAHRYLDAQQVRADIPDGRRYYRSPIEGSWPFSTAEQTWTVSDCTAEALKAALRMENRVETPIPRARTRAAVDFLLAGQNPDGGWSEYERARVGDWIEGLNAAEVFGPIMRAYSYVECTSACMQALDAHRAVDLSYRSEAIETSIARGLEFVRSRQRSDGGFVGGWGLCFSYGTWFGIDAMKLRNLPEDRARIARAARFLLSKQRPDGLWSESYRGSVERRWIDHEDALPVQSGWALLGLMSARRALSDTEWALSERLRTATERGIRALVDAQNAEGHLGPKRDQRRVQYNVHDPLRQLPPCHAVVGARALSSNCTGLKFAHGCWPERR